MLHVSWPHSCTIGLHSWESCRSGARLKMWPLPAPTSSRLPETGGCPAAWNGISEPHFGASKEVLRAGHLVHSERTLPSWGLFPEVELRGYECGWRQRVVVKSRRNLSSPRFERAFARWNSSRRRFSFFSNEHWRLASPPPLKNVFLWHLRGGAFPEMEKCAQGHVLWDQSQCTGRTEARERGAASSRVLPNWASQPGPILTPHKETCRFVTYLALSGYGTIAFET